MVANISQLLGALELAVEDLHTALAVQAHLLLLELSICGFLHFDLNRRFVLVVVENLECLPKTVLVVVAGV